MYILLSFRQQVEDDPIRDNPLRRTSITLIGEPVIVQELPAGVGSEMKFNHTPNSRDFYYYINCKEATLSTVQAAIALFNEEYINNPDDRFISNVDPKKIPAIIIFKTALQRCTPIAKDNNTANKGRAASLPEESFYSVNSRYFFFGGIAVAGILASAFILGRSNQ